jgi:hypothetical protein
MTWIFWLGLAVAIGVIAAVTGVKPTGTRPVARTRLMGVARFALFFLLLLFLYLAYRGYSTR